MEEEIPDLQVSGGQDFTEKGFVLSLNLQVSFTA